MKLREFISACAGRLEGRYGRREAENIAWLVAESLGGATRRDLALDPAAQFDAQAAAEAVERVAGGEPVQYVLGEAWFCGERFEVGPQVLIPRPETEELVRWIVSEHAGPHKIIDVGTGSGAIAVMLALLDPQAAVSALDVSPSALRMAGRNAANHSVDIELIEADILSATLAGTFDIVVSNPPYIPAGEMVSMQPHVTGHEPHTALFVPDGDPLLFYRAIINGARGEWYYFEAHEKYAEELCRMLRETGMERVELRRDIHGKDRMVRCKRK